MEGIPTFPLFCPYCDREVERTVKVKERDDLGEHCDCCCLPFDIDEYGLGVGQDGERSSKPWHGVDKAPLLRAALVAREQLLAEIRADLATLDARRQRGEFR